ncbi:MAG: hypothetical protein LBM16_05610, partial [Clostridiales bacterium]|nr:hypothetical protein [Clostridiales bacterium]
YTASGSNWSRVDSVYDEVSGQMNFSTVNTGTYAGVAVSAPKMEETDLDAQISTASVQSRMNIQDVGSILPKSPVTASQFNKILSAVAKGSKDVRINDAVTTAETNSLTKAGILAADSQIVSREAALSALAKLYEIKTKTQIKNYSATSVDGTSEKYKAGVQKAAFAGLVDGLARPNDGITFAELLKAVDVIMADAGL